jgi:hypothetical protein
MGFKLDATLLPVFLAGSIAAAVRSVALVTTLQRLDNAAWQRPDMGNVRKGVLAEGLSNVVGGLLGAQGMNLGPSLVGIASVTGVASRAVGYSTAAIMIIMGFVPKISAIFLMVPQQVAGSLLVFTSCFMLAGGMEIMLSRRGDVRATYILGISTLLALSGTLYPDYFKHFSPAVSAFIGNPLSFGLATAIALSLLFRIGARQHARTRWSLAAGEIEEAISFIRKTGAAKTVDPKIVEEAAAEVRSLLERLQANDQHRHGGELDLSTDGADFRVEITCPAGHEPSAPGIAGSSTPPAYAIDTEEAAVVAGLKTFLETFAAERKEVVQDKTGARVILTYGG